MTLSKNSEIMPFTILVLLSRFPHVALEFQDHISFLHVKLNVIILPQKKNHSATMRSSVWYFSTICKLLMKCPVRMCVTEHVNFVQKVRFYCFHWSTRCSSELSQIILNITIRLYKLPGIVLLVSHLFFFLCMTVHNFL